MLIVTVIVDVGRFLQYTFTASVELSVRGKNTAVLTVA
jgi:hypothetical protein